jgi:hypothetical protein
MASDTYHRNSDSVVSTTTTLWDGRQWVQIPAETKDLSIPRNIQTGSGAHLAFCSMGTAVLFRR